MCNKSPCLSGFCSGRGKWCQIPTLPLCGSGRQTALVIIPSRCAQAGALQMGQALSQLSSTQGRSHRGILGYRGAPGLSRAQQQPCCEGVSTWEPPSHSKVILGTSRGKFWVFVPISLPTWWIPGQSGWGGGPACEENKTGSRKGKVGSFSGLSLHHLSAAELCWGRGSPGWGSQLWVLSGGEKSRSSLWLPFCSPQRDFPLSQGLTGVAGAAERGFQSISECWN